ncbi:MAG: hypothetical protein WBR26_03335 [Candidatus Acidiferrum sp.]
MSRFRPQAPWEFLLTASRSTLQSYELSRLAHAANLRKEIGELLDQYMEECTSAKLSRWLIEQREHSVLASEASGETEVVPEMGSSNGHTASDNFLADRMPPPHTPRNRS